jgi:uncharacterized protein (TIGR04255 family)
VAFLLQFDRQINDATYAEVRKAGETFKELPGRSEIQGIRFGLGTGGALAGVANGNAFHRSRPDGTVEDELRLDRFSITYRTMNYTRWDAVWRLARSYFERTAPHYARTARVTAVGLNFVDKFVWVGTPSECRPNLLLRPGSRYVVPHVYPAKDLWHSHTGIFERWDDQTKRLMNVNVDCTDEAVANGQRRVIGIMSVLTDMLNQTDYAPLELASEATLAFLDERMQQLHVVAKALLGNVINDEMCKRIALTD